VVLALITFGSV